MDSVTEGRILHIFCFKTVHEHEEKRLHKSSNTLFLKVHSVLVIAMSEFAFWADFTLSLLLYSCCHTASSTSFPIIFTRPSKCAIYSSNSWAAAERSSSSAIKLSPASLLSCFIPLLLSRPVFPREAAQLVALMSLLKPVPRYPRASVTKHSKEESVTK